MEGGGGEETLSHAEVPRISASRAADGSLDAATSVPDQDALCEIEAKKRSLVSARTPARVTRTTAAGRMRTGRLSSGLVGGRQATASRAPPRSAHPARERQAEELHAQKLDVATGQTLDQLLVEVVLLDARVDPFAVHLP